MKSRALKPTKVIEGEGGPSQAGWHQISDFLACPKRFQLKHIRHIRTPVIYDKPAFSVGTLLHAGRAKWLALKCKTDAKSIEIVNDKIKEEVRNAKLPMTAEAERFALMLMSQYIDHWSKRPLPTTFATEYTLGPAPLAPNDPLWLMRTAKLDDFGKYPESANQLVIGELKTTSASVANVINEYTLHGQTMLQQWLWRVSEQGLKQHGPVKGTVLDIVVKGYGTKKPVFAREFIPFSEFQLKWFIDSLRGYLKAAVSIDYNSLVPRNTEACTKRYGDASRETLFPCEFRELCKYGQAKAVAFIDETGTQLHKWQPTDEKKVAPWE